jgi:hypothetical protein
VTDLGRVGLAVSASQPNTLYATVDAQPATGGIYRSDAAEQELSGIASLVADITAQAGNAVQGLAPR